MVLDAAAILKDKTLEYVIHHCTLRVTFWRENERDFSFGSSARQKVISIFTNAQSAFDGTQNCRMSILFLVASSIQQINKCVVWSNDSNYYRRC